MLERDEAIKILIAVTMEAIEVNPDVGRRLTKNDRDNIKRSIMEAPLHMLQRRIYALQKQAPEILLRAMQRAGYSVKVDGAGGVEVGLSEQSSGPGRTIDYDKFMASMEKPS